MGFYSVLMSLPLPTRSRRAVVRERDKRVMGEGPRIEDAKTKAEGAQETADAALVQPPIGSWMGWGGTTDPPDGKWLICDGRILDRTQYADLFAATSTTWNIGGETVDQFRIPDFRGRAPVGAGQGSGLSNRALASKFGAETHAATVAEMPNHDHGDGTTSENTHSHTGWTSSSTHSHNGSTGGNVHTHGTILNWYRFIAEWNASGRSAYSPAVYPDQSTAISDSNPSHLHGIGDSTHDHTVGIGDSTHDHTIAPEGGGQPHPNVQPSTAAHWIIRVQR